MKLPTARLSVSEDEDPAGTAERSGVETKAPGVATSLSISMSFTERSES